MAFPALRRAGSNREIGTLEPSTARRKRTYCARPLSWAAGGAGEIETLIGERIGSSAKSVGARRHGRSTDRAAYRLFVAFSLSFLAACSEVPAATSSKIDPAARVEPVEGTDLKKLVLTEQAVEHIGITVVPVAPGPASTDGLERRVVPHSAVLFQPTGAALVYTNPAPLVFVRQPVTVESFQGEAVILSAGPPPGTGVVSVGGAELLGVEFGVGK